MSTAAAKRKEAPSSQSAAAAEDTLESRRITLTPKKNVSPYEARQEEFAQLRQQRGEEFVIAVLYDDPLSQLTDERLAEVLDDGVSKDRSDLEELDEDVRKAALQKMTQQEVDDILRVMIVPEKLFDTKETLTESILFADTRNERGNSFLMLNTHSTWCST